VVNADSVQVYRHLDIGSAKASALERRTIAHYLIDIRDPWETWNAKDFVTEADIACSLIRRLGKIPVISGGTAFYFRSFLYGLSDAPASDASVREEVARFLREQGNAEAHSYLKRIDPVSAARINVNDTYRISRAIEVYRTSGRALSSFDVPKKPRKGPAVLAIGLQCDREILARRIHERVLSMFAGGLVDEIRHLLEMGANPGWQSMQGIGYREFMTALEGGKSLDNLDFEAIAGQIAVNSIHYAKRQMTFFRSFTNVHWIDAWDVKALLSILNTELPDCQWG